MNAVARLCHYVRRTLAQAPGLRVPFVVAPLHHKLDPLLRRRLRSLGVSKAKEVVARLGALAPAFATGSVDPSEGDLLYGLVRSLRPDLIVETGTAIADDVFLRKHDALPAFARSVERGFTTFGNLGIIVK
ncbi:MAG: hypothetical protein ACYDA3_12685 [Gaiellaceae bacterium]